MAMNIQRAEEGRTVDIAEKGRYEGEVISLDRRLFMQLLAFGGVSETNLLIAALNDSGIPGVLYEDINDPAGVALLTFAEEPDFFLETLRPFLHQEPFAALSPKPEYTMLGRTYSIGYEADLERVLIGRPIERVVDPEMPWAIWYPLRRSGAFEQLSQEEQRKILMEHGGIGRAYGEAGLAVDIRLASFGLDKHDNDFVIGLLGHELYPLSRVVQRMRKTQQTSKYLTNLGPFFIGKAVWQKKIN
jgi:chlorite dismutase